MRLLLPLLLLLPLPTLAQTTAEKPEAEAVRAHIVQLFDAMRASDAVGVRDHFHETSTLYSVSVGPDGETRVQSSPITQFAEAIAGEHPIFDERIGPIEVRLDGALATAYMPYAFYVGGQFSHCGVNAFHLARTAQGWKTIHVTDTRRRTDCDPSIAPD